MLVESGKRFVAFFDLLGFSSWLEADGSSVVFTYVRGFLNLMIRASLPGSVVNQDMSVTVEASDIGFINFSDSIVFYSRDDSDACFDTMLRVCGEFMNGVITGPSRLLRGAISHGEFFADPNANAYVGQALLDAYRLESAQDWLACSFHYSVVALPQFARALEAYPSYIVPALVPLRDSSVIPYCLNWADKRRFHYLSFSAERGLADCEQRARASLVDNATELTKLERRMRHTREFISHYNGLE
ncbi:MAG: hypothetical protein HYX75_25405 [Acidobacteria bacterium]|nr:hypothetical protein [Acidobacteriota bacterium]